MRVDSLVNWMLISEVLVGNALLTILRDTGCSGVIVKRHLLKGKQLTVKIGYVMTVAPTFFKAPLANVEVSTSYFNGILETLYLKDPLYQLIIGNISGARAPDNPNETWCVKAPAIIRSQAG